MPLDFKPDDFDSDALVRKPFKDRRSSRVTPGSLKWIKGILGRPLTLEKRDRSARLVLVDRRRRPEVIRAEALKQLSYELTLRLTELESGTARHAVRHLIAVHDALTRKGWSGVEMQPSRVLSKAVVQAQLISAREDSPRMRAFVDHLRKLQVASEVREDRLLHIQQTASAAAVEVHESTPEAFEASQREWVGTVVLTKDKPG